MSKEVSINDVLKALQENNTLAESAANYQMLEQAIAREMGSNGEETHRMLLLYNLRAFQLKRVLAKL